jgi:hypothetical protein
MVARLRVSVGTVTEEDDSIPGRVWAVGIHHVTARSRLARVLKFMNDLFLNVQILFRAAVNRG